MGMSCTLSQRVPSAPLRMSHLLWPDDALWQCLSLKHYQGIGALTYGVMGSLSPTLTSCWAVPSEDDISLINVIVFTKVGNGFTAK